MYGLSYEIPQQYHKHGVMHRVLNSLKNCRCIKAIKLILSMVHNGLAKLSVAAPNCSEVD